MFDGSIIGIVHCIWCAERNALLSRQLRRQIGVVRRQLTQKKREQKPSDSTRTSPRSCKYS